MAIPLDPKQIVSLEELLMSQIIQQEALSRLLVEKGIFTKEEFLEMVERINGHMNKKQKGGKTSIQTVKVEINPKGSREMIKEKDEVEGLIAYFNRPNFEVGYLGLRRTTETLTKAYGTNLGRGTRA